MTDFTSGRESRSGVSRIIGRSVLLLMARVAQGSVERVVPVQVAVPTSARRHHMRPGQLESGARMIESAVRPLHRVVTAFTGQREACRHVIHRRHGIGVVRLMARHARSARDVVVVVDVTIRALPRGYSVGTVQRESSAVVIERCVEPRTGVVALIASLREIGRNVVRICRPLKVLQMTADAAIRRQVVVVIGVALGALPRGHRVQSGQGKIGQVVIKRCVRP